MGKKHPLCTLVIVSILFSLCSPALAETDGGLSLDEVTEIAWAYMAQSSGLTAGEMADFHCQMQELGDEWNGTRHWSIVFVSDITGLEFWVQVDYRSGAVYDAEQSGFAEAYRWSCERARLRAIADEAIEGMEPEKGPYVFWSYEDKAAFSEEYPGADPCDLPGDGDLSEAEAVQIAQAEMKQALLADEAYVSRYRLDICFRKVFYWDDVITPTWLITYRMKEPAADGGYPVRHTALVSAASGEIVLIVYANEAGELVSTDGYQDEMYHNPDGGKYFHHDADCWTVDERYRPLTAYARGDVIHDDALWVLMPCPRCVFHHEEDWGSDWTRG